MQAVIDAYGWSEWPAPAKLNLFLRITGHRADGYHQLQTVFQLLDWGDSIRLRLRDDGAIVRIGGNEAVEEVADLAVRAARELQRAAGILWGCEIEVIKRIPVGGGFGGGSSDAATVLVALNKLWKAGLDLDDLAALGMTLGADVPVFVRGRNAWAEGIGEALQPLALAPAWYLIVDPGVRVPTAALFQAADLTRDAPPVTIRDFTGGVPPGLSLGNAFEPLLRRQEAAIAAALDALSVFGLARVTGSGGGCFVAFANHGSAQAALAALPSGLRAWIAQGVERSPLLDRLEQM
jgi:4-diphosphocytidyl-2-C-methyl-D-erythritol kinase